MGAGATAAAYISSATAEIDAVSMTAALDASERVPFGTIQVSYGVTFDTGVRLRKYSIDFPYHVGGSIQEIQSHLLGYAEDLLTQNGL